MTSLIKKDEDTLPKDALALLASEVAAEAAARSKKGGAGTKTLDDEMDDDEDPKQNLSGGVEQDIAAEAHDIRERGIHHLDLQQRLPWLKSPLKNDNEEQDDQTQEILSPDSSEDPLSPDVIASLHDLTTEDHKSIASSVHSLAMNGYIGDSPKLPPKDYQTDHTPPGSYHSDDILPPRDYPSNNGGGSQTQLLDDNDYYSMIPNGH